MVRFTQLDYAKLVLKSIESCYIFVYNAYMGKKLGWIILALTIIFASVFIFWRVSHAQIGRSEFPESGHSIRGEVYRFYWSNPDPIHVYGYPITELTTDVSSGRLVQYFQRAVFVLNPEAPRDQRIQLAPLGEYLYVPGDPISITGNLSNCKTFNETGFQVCYAFLDFFKANGGLEQFGYPISNFELQHGRVVQYFQRARFEWYPELPSGQRVKLADVGSEHFYTVGEDLDKIRRNETNQTVLKLRASAYPEDPVTKLNDKQTIHVLVQDQNRQPVPYAMVEVLVYLPSGRQFRNDNVETGENGFATVTFDIEEKNPGRALVWVIVNFEKLDEYLTSTSFRIWY